MCLIFRKIKLNYLILRKKKLKNTFPVDSFAFFLILFSNLEVATGTLEYSENLSEEDGFEDFMPLIGGLSEIFLDVVLIFVWNNSWLLVENNQKEKI